jgi:iron complex outermembrane recepter protein
MTKSSGTILAGSRRPEGRSARTAPCIHRALLGGIGALTAWLGLARPALADDAATEPKLEEIVVTAQKRAENLQNVPIAVTVVGADTFAKANVSGFADLAKFAPSLTATAGDQPANSALIIRGVGTFAYSIAAEPSVLVVIDDVAVGYQAQAFTDLVDIDRVEVLNGPQSTLFGKSASAGLVNVTTKAPTNTFTYFGDVKFTTDREERATLSLSGPVSDTVSFRLSAAARYWGGNVHNSVSGGKIDDDRQGSVRGKLQWKPSDNLDAQFTLHFNEDRADCCGVPLIRVDPGAHFFGVAALPLAVANPGVTPGPNNTTVSVDQVPKANQEDVGFTSHVSYDFGDVTFLSITGIDQYHLHDLTDYDTTPDDVLQYFTPFTNTQPAGSSPGSSTQQHGGMFQGGRFSVTTFSQEFRLASNGHHDFNYLAGAYFSNEDLVRVFGRGFVGNTKAIANWRGETRYNNYALFGQTTWTFLPRTTLITGLRLNREESSYTYDDYYRVIHFPSFGHPTQNVDSVVTGKAGLQYQLTDDIMAFAFYAKGYKGVAYDLVTGLSAVEAASFPVRPEKSNDYEAGLRSEWLDRRLALNVTAYDTEYSDFQVQTIIPNILNTFILTNIPKVRSRGLELESVAQVTRDLHVNLGYAYTDAHAVDYPIGQCYSGQVIPATCTASPAYQNLNGATLPNAPKNKVTLAMDYKHGIPGLGLDGELNVSSFWQSAEDFSINKDPGTLQAPYGITNLDLGLTPHQVPNLTVHFFCNNLFDRHYAVNINNVKANWTFPSAGETAYNHELPRDYDRYYGVRIAFTNL